VEARFEFRNKELGGQPEERARWRRATQLVNGSLGEVLGKEYVKRYFPPDSKAKVGGGASRPIKDRSGTSN
jgi:putative endopeptidase